MTDLTQAARAAAVRICDGIPRIEPDRFYEPVTAIILKNFAPLLEARDAYAAQLRVECERCRVPIDGVFLQCRLCRMSVERHLPDCPHATPLPEVPG